MTRREVIDVVRREASRQLREQIATEMNAMNATAAALAGAITTATIATQTTMHPINTKTIAAVLASALAAGTGTDLGKQRETDRLRTENQKLIAQHEGTANERDAALSAARRIKDDIDRLRKDQTELLHLRNEVGRVA